MIREAIIGTTFCCSHFRLDAILINTSIIAQRNLLNCTFLGIARNSCHLSSRQKDSGSCRCKILPDGIFSILRIKRLDKNVAIFLPTSRTAHMHLRETFDGLWHRSPSCIRHRHTIRSWLHHSVWHGRSGESSSQSLTSNTWIDILGIVLRHCPQGAKTASDDKDCFSHHI